MKDKPTVGSPSFGLFPYYYILKVRKDIYVHFFIHSSNAVNYTSEFQEVFEDRVLFMALSTSDMFICSSLGKAVA